MLRPRMSSSGRGPWSSPWGVQPLMPPWSGASLAPCALAGDRRSPGLVPAGGAVFSLVRVTTNPNPL